MAAHGLCRLRADADDNVHLQPFSVLETVTCSYLGMGSRPATVIEPLQPRRGTKDISLASFSVDWASKEGEQAANTSLGSDN